MGIAALHPSSGSRVFVMAGLVPAIHVFPYFEPSKDVDARVKPGHDELFARADLIETLLFVIASEAKQSRARKRGLDCFASLAMTGSETPLCGIISAQLSRDLPILAGRLTEARVSHCDGSIRKIDV